MYFHTKVDHDMHSKVLERTMNVFKKKQKQKKREINIKVEMTVCSLFMNGSL